MSGVRIIRAGELSSETSQTPGMSRMTAVSADSDEARGLWVGRVTVAPGTRSGAHHHGECLSVICVTSGRIQFRYGDRLEHTAEAGPGDYVYVPARVIHQEINPSDSEPIDSIVIRDSPENVVVNVALPED